MNYRFLFFLLLAFDAGAAPLPSVQSFFETPKVSHVRLSPQGSLVASVGSTPAGTDVLMVRSTSDPGKISAIASTTENETITAVHWINENRIGFTVKNLRLEFLGNLDEMAADADGGNRVHLISGNWAHQREATGTSLKSQLLTADYVFFDVAHDGSDDILVEKYSWNNIDRQPDHSRLYRLNTRTRKLRAALEGTQPNAVKSWLTDTRDEPRVVRSTEGGRCISAYRKPGESAWRELSNQPCLEGAGFQPVFFDGDDTLYVQASYQGYGALYRYDLKAMKMDAQPMIFVPGFDFAGAPEIDYASGRLLGLHLQNDAGTSWWQDPQLKAEQAKIDALMPATTNTIRCADQCLASPVLLVVASSDRQPDHYILYQRAGGTLVSLGSAHPDIQPAQMGLRDFHRYRARDGRSIPAYVTTPPGKASGPRPTVVLVHGGPQVRGGYWDWDSQAQFLASRGYLVIQPEFRGSTGYGADHFRAGWKQWGMAMQDDVADAAQWAVKQGWADPRRIAIMGASYGGYATLMGLIKNPELFRCGVEWAGVTDIGLMFSSTQSDMSQESLKYGLRTLIGDPDQDGAQFRRYSPLLRAAELTQPLLMAHGLEDVRVPIEHAKSFRDAVGKHNENVEYLTYADEAHGWRHAANRIDFWTRVAAFLDRNLR